MDKREAILAQLILICQSIEGIVKVTRNQGNISEEQRPAIVILDGDEEADENDTGRGRPAAAPNLVTMTPQVSVLLGSLTENVGTELNGFRAKVIKAILGDNDLAAIVGSNGGGGESRYRGCATSTSSGRQMEGEMGMFFSFRYNLMINKL
jgi:hypothetical protein